MHNLPETRSKQFVLGIVILTLVAVGGSFAANINLASSGSSEFSQGVYKIAACDDWVRIDMGQTAAEYEGLSRISSFIIDGLDPFACESTSFRIQAYKTGDPDTSPRPLYYNVADDETVTSVSLLIDNNANVQLARPIGNPATLTGIGTSDAEHQLTYDQAAGTFTVTFAHPLALMGDIYYLKISSDPI
jgi:hypothetical protein